MATPDLDFLMNSPRDHRVIYSIGRLQLNKEELEIPGTHTYLVHADANKVTLYASNSRTIDDVALKYGIDSNPGTTKIVGSGHFYVSGDILFITAPHNWSAPIPEAAAAVFGKKLKLALLDMHIGIEDSFTEGDFSHPHQYWRYFLPQEAMQPKIKK